MRRGQAVKGGCHGGHRTPPAIETYDIESFGPAVRSRRFDFARLQDRLDAPLDMPHRHDFHQIVWVTHGKGRHVIDWEIHPIRDGAVFCLPPGHVHSWDVDAAATGYVFNVDPGLMLAATYPDTPAAALPRAEWTGIPKALYLTAPQTRTLLDIVSKLEREYQRDDADRDAALQAHFQLFLIALRRCRNFGAPVCTPIPAAEPGTALAERFRTAVEQHFRERLTVHAYAVLLDVSESHLSHTVRKRTGMTATHYLQERLVDEARRLLVHVDASIAAIACELGIEDPAYFSRLFRKHTGQSPKEFKSSFVTALHGPRIATGKYKDLPVPS